MQHCCFEREDEEASQVKNVILNVARSQAQRARQHQGGCGTSVCVPPGLGSIWKCPRSVKSIRLRVRESRRRHFLKVFIELSKTGSMSITLLLVRPTANGPQGLEMRRDSIDHHTAVRVAQNIVLEPLGQSVQSHTTKVTSWDARLGILKEMFRIALRSQNPGS